MRGESNYTVCCSLLGICSQGSIPSPGADDVVFRGGGQQYIHVTQYWRYLITERDPDTSPTRPTIAESIQSHSNTLGRPRERKLGVEQEQRNVVLFAGQTN